MTNKTYLLNEVCQLLKEISIDTFGLIDENNIFLLSKQKISSLIKSEDCLGFIRIYGNSVEDSSRFEIYILDSLNRPQLEGVLAHEIFHAYSWYNQLNLSPLIEEGSAELASYYVYQRIGEKSTKKHQDQLLYNTYQLYGDGFKKVYSTAKQLGGIKNYFQFLIPTPLNKTKPFNKNICDSIWTVNTPAINQNQKKWWFT